ncbi:hypothetical protein DICSQDRAFT_171245 [Dichomitus squalens LYAD-421 SS1]|uniref:Uncharacterized protein n=1 Tax=Dichomitus squalens (strain LYAD-421) TaxID=732165 RepID=R7SWG9_DICSQ|nr:uncharacterized protein DICSQDRAFT_171245 [Dichomitus squalens LYAD-421 SS1]EJF60283.1 hypothetical protein DICSQDRAFT_171245 [Dichomitus squalens LYAD-421 SS1]
MSNETPSLNAAGTFAGPASIGFYFAALVLEIVFFGAFVGTYAYGSWLILCRAHPATRRQTSTVVLFAANTLMFLLSLVHLALDIDIARIGFLTAPKSLQEAKFVLYVTQTLIGDGFMIYRLYRVYSRHWPVTIVPSLLLILTAVIGYASSFLGVAGFYIRDFNGVYLQGHKLKLWKVLEATVQSTAIYSAAAVSLVITFVNSTAVGYPTCLDVFPALIGLVFSLITIRIATNLIRDEARPDSNFRLTETVRSRQTASSVTYVEHEPHPSILQALGSQKGAMQAYKDKVGNDVIEMSKHVSKSATTSEVSLPLSRLNFQEVCDGDVKQGEAV